MTAAPPHPAGLPRWDDHDDLPLPSLAGDAEADLCVVGLGGSGLACLTEAMALGATRVIGVDATGIAAGAAGRAVPWRGRERAASFKAWTSSRRESSRNCFRPRRGLATTATAPAASASSA